MWIFTPQGMFSIVQHRQNPDVLLVRARCREDLQAFADSVLGAGNGTVKIKRTPQADYRWRCTVPRDVFIRWLYGQAMGIRYPNFKAAVHGEPDRDLAYTRCWHAMRDFQDNRVRAGGAG